MRHKIGTFFMILGTAFVLAALSLLMYNQHTAHSAEKISTEVLPKLIAQVEQNHSGQDVPDIPADWNASDMPMDTLTIDGEDYIGYLTIPVLGLELPVISEWSYPRLRMAPCRFSGTLGGNDLVVMAHNYTTHFAFLSNLSPGDAVYFRDVHGIVSQYDVVAVDILLPTAVDEMTAGDFDLTLFTCTYGGQNRVTVRCNRS